MRSIILSLFFAFTFAAARALAQPVADGGEARRHYEEGVRLYSERKLSEAEAELEQAWALAQSYDVAGQLGAVEFELGRHRDAAEHLSFALGHLPVGAKAETRATVEERLKRAAAEVGEVRVTVSVEAALVSVDGAKPTAQRTLFLEPGPHELVASAGGYESQSRRTEAVAGKTEEVRFDLERASKSAVPSVLLGATSAALLATGIGLTVAASGKGADADAALAELEAGHGGAPCAHPTDEATIEACVAVTDGLKARDGLTAGAAVSYVLAGVGLVGLVVYVATPSSSEETNARVWLTPALGVGHGGLELFGRF